MSVFSPRFKSAAAMAGWDEETLLLVVEDTPERNLKNKKRSDLSFKSPPSSNCSRRRRRRARPGSIPMAFLNLDDDEGTSNTNTNQKDETKDKNEDLTKKVEETSKEKEEKSENCSNSSTLACMDRLKEELSCSICLDICYEPSTTPCGHSFCKNCLKSAADKCGKRCPKCRQLISNGRSCTVNTVLWNTIQLLFPQEVELRKAAIDAAWRSRVTDQRKKSPERMISSSNQGDTSNALMARRLRVSSRSEDVNFRSAREVLNQDEDAALALRLQREEFMEIYRGPSLARDNLRAMARRAMNLARNRAV